MTQTASIFLSLSIALLAGLILSRLAKLVKLPAVTAYLIAGVLIFCLLIEKRTPAGTGLSRRLCVPKYLLGWVLGAVMMSLIAAMCAPI